MNRRRDAGESWDGAGVPLALSVTTYWAVWLPPMKSLLPGFLHHRELLDKLGQAAWGTVAEMIDAAATELVQPGMVAVQQTARSDLARSPHIHALARRGGRAGDGRWLSVPQVDPVVAERLLQHRVMSFLMAGGLADRGAGAATAELASVENRRCRRGSSSGSLRHDDGYASETAS